jgi:hypothetical protein
VEAHAHLIVADGGFTAEDSFLRRFNWEKSELLRQFASPNPCNLTFSRMRISRALEENEGDGFEKELERLVGSAIHECQSPLPWYR